MGRPGGGVQLVPALVPAPSGRGVLVTVGCELGQVGFEVGDEVAVVDPDIVPAESKGWLRVTVFGWRGGLPAIGVTDLGVGTKAWFESLAAPAMEPEGKG